MSKETKVWQKFARWGTISVIRSESGDFHMIEVRRPTPTPSRYAAIGEAQKIADRMDEVFDETGRFFFSQALPQDAEDHETLRKTLQRERFEEYLDYWDKLAGSDLPARPLAQMAAVHIRSMMEAMEDR